MPLIEECLDTLSGNVWFSKLDANSAFHQIKIRPEDQMETTFVTRYEFARMGFELCNALATFSVATNLVLQSLTWKIVLAYLDDALALNKDFEDNQANLRRVIARFREFDLKFKPKKCALFQRRREFLGLQVSPEGVEMRDSYVGYKTTRHLSNSAPTERANSALVKFANSAPRICKLGT